MMVLNLKVDNFKGILKPIELSCIASNKTKHEINEVSIISEKNKALKNICIIGSNASGKTSLLDAIKTVQDFLNFPYRKKFTDDKEYKKFINEMSSEELKDFLIKFNKLELGEQNNTRLEDKTSIEIEVFVPNRKKNISGIYLYTLLYKNDYASNGVIMEKLEYRKKYNSSRSKLISLHNNIIESEVSRSVLFKNNRDNVNDENYIYCKSFFDELITYTDILKDGVRARIEKNINNNKNLFVKLCNIADEKIIDVTIDENEKNSRILFWNSNCSYLTFSQLSEGTRKTIVMGCLIMDALSDNRTMIIDEIELSLHSKLVMFLVELNIAKDCNHFSQLIFTTHSPVLAFTMAGDQLYFINNKDSNYFVSNINNAIKKGIITKDQSVEKAWVTDLLINNPDNKKISDFLCDKEL